MAASPSLSTNAARLRRQAHLATSVHAALLIAVIGGMAVTILEAGARFRQEASLRTGVLLLFAGIIGVGAVWHLVHAVTAHVAARPRIVPYFSNKYFKQHDPTRKTSEESVRAFNSGYGLAADLDALDDLARAEDVTPLSHFGFGDDRLNQRPHWSDLGDGTRTARTLVARVASGDNRLSPTTESDLRALLAVLEKATETQPSFALIVRYGRDDVISGAEMNRRKGTFWC